MASQYERIRRIAKAWSRMEDAVAVIFRNEDGTFGFVSAAENIQKPIVEYITPY